MASERQVLFWVVAAGLLFIALAALNDILLPFVVGIILAYALSPVVDMLERRGVGRGLASLGVVTLIIVVVLLLVILIVPLLARQARELFQALPGTIETMRGLVEDVTRERLGPDGKGLEKASGAVAENWQGLAAWLAGSLWTGGLAVVNFLALAVVTPVVVFYLLVDWHRMLDRVDSWLPRDHAPTIRKLARDMDRSVSAFVRGQGAVCLIMAAFYGIGLTLTGLNYGLLIGLMSGFITFIPYAGAALGLLTAAGVAIMQFWPELMPIAIVVGVFMAGQALEGLVLTPYIMGSSIGVHPVWVLFALFVFGYLFGFVGALIAVPLAAAAGVLIRFALDIYLDSSVYRGTQPAAVPSDKSAREGQP